MKFLQILVCILLFHWSCNAQIFTKGKKIYYDIQYFRSDPKSTIEEIISLEIIGNSWKGSQDQKEAIWNYRTNQKVKNQFKDQFSFGWLTSDTTGIIENERKVWIHPPRNNQYSLNELAPFPDFRKGLKVGNSYQAILFIGDGCGPWTGKKVKCKYTIINVEQEQSETIWTVNATSEIEGKVNTLKYIFSDQKGFVSMEYLFYNGDKEILKIKE